MNHRCGCKIPQAHFPVLNQMSKNLKVIAGSLLFLKCAFRVTQEFLIFFSMHI